MTALDQLIEGLSSEHRENVLKAVAEAHVSATDPFLAVMLAVHYQMQSRQALTATKSQMPERKTDAMWLGLIAGVFGAAIASSVILTAWQTRADREMSNLIAQIRENSQMIADIREAGGETRYYAAKDASGKDVRVLTINGGKAKPTEAFLNAAGAATVLFPGH
jgi:hypothetical protein